MQNVLAPVTNKNGKTYNTMFTIQRTSNINSPMAQRESERLEGLGINIKTIGGREIMSLPGAQDYSSARQWREASDAEYEANVRERLMSYKSPTQITMARNQMTSYHG